MAKHKDRPARASSIAAGWTIEGAEHEAAETSVLAEPADPRPDAAAEDSPPSEQLPAWALVVFGLTGGVYLLYTIVWLSWAQHYSAVNSLIAEESGSLGGVMQQIVYWLAPLAPVLWFVCVLVLSRRLRPGKMLLWFALGALLLVPLPMFEGGLS